jgi:hypothetical protein
MISMKKTLLTFSALLASLSFSAGQSDTSVRFGETGELGFLFRGSGTYDSNLTLSEDDRESGTYVTLTPGVNVTLGDNVTPFDLNFTGTYSLVRYTDKTRYNTHLWNLNGRGAYSLARTDISLTGSYREIQANQPDVEAIDDIVVTKTARGGLNALYQLSPKFNFGAGGSAEHKTYDGGNNLTRNIYTVPVDVFYALTPKLQTTGGFRYRDTVVDGGVDTKDYFFNGGITGQLTPKLRSRVRLGYQLREFNDSQSNKGSFSILSNSTYDATRRDQIGLQFNRDFATSGAGQSINKTSGGLTYRHEFPWELTVSTGVTLQYNDYVDDPRDDTNVSGRVGLEYAINRYASANVMYSYRNNNSNQDGSSYHANMIRIGAGLRY